MKNIILLCAAGMSTSLLVQKIREAADKKDYECTVNAHAIAEAENYKDMADIMLLGPQVRFQIGNVKEKCPGIPVETIDPVIYGQMNGEKVLERIMEILGE